jgi:hypothetical protein
MNCLKVSEFLGYAMELDGGGTHGGGWHGNGGIPWKVTEKPTLD